MTLTVELESDVYVPNQKFLPTKTASHGLILQNLCILSPITSKAQGKTKTSVVMNLNVSANDINTFKVLNTRGKF